MTIGEVQHLRVGAGEKKSLQIVGQRDGPEAECGVNAAGRGGERNCVPLHPATIKQGIDEIFRKEWCIGGNAGH